MLNFRIVTPERIVYADDRVMAVVIPTEDGEITVLPGHIPLISVLRAGILKVKKADYTVDLAVSGGVVEIRPGNQIYILADTAERAEEIDLERAEAAKARAEEQLRNLSNQLDEDYARVYALLEKELARIRASRLRSG